MVESEKALQEIAEHYGFKDKLDKQRTIARFHNPDPHVEPRAEKPGRKRWISRSRAVGKDKAASSNLVSLSIKSWMQWRPGLFAALFQAKPEGWNLPDPQTDPNRISTKQATYSRGKRL